VVIFIKSYHYFPYFADDSFISLRYAQRLIDGYGLTWTEGIPVEGYSNLLWTLIMAAFGWIGVDMVFAARLVGVGLAIANSYLIVKYISRRVENATVIIGIVLLFYSFSGTVAVWSIAGLEQPLVAFLALSAIYNFLNFKDYNTKNSLWLSSLSLGLLAITRPDGAMLAGILFMVYLFWNRKELKKALPNAAILVLFTAIFYIGQLAFRLYYYGDYVPNTAHVKVSPSLYHAWYGLKYTLRFAKSIAVLVLIAFACISYLNKENRERFILYLVILASWFAYLSFIAGDIFMAFRHHYYTIVVLMLLLSDGLPKLIKDLNKQKLTKPFAIILSLGAMFYVYHQFENNNYENIETYHWTLHQKTLGLALKDVFEEEQPLIAVDAAGSIPYWTKFPALDMLGLNDYHIARNKPGDMGGGFIGHELGDPEYTMDMRPDIFEIHAGLRTPHWYIDSAVMRHPEFVDYIPIGLYVEEYNGFDFSGVLWFDKYSRKVGVKEKENRLIIPGYLFLPNDTSDVAIFRNKNLVRPIKSGVDYRLSLRGNQYKYTDFEPTPNGINIETKIDADSIIYTLKNLSDTTINLIEVVAKKEE
jgi:hypothetical protein